MKFSIAMLSAMVAFFCVSMCAAADIDSIKQMCKETKRSSVVALLKLSKTEGKNCSKEPNNALGRKTSCSSPMLSILDTNLLLMQHGGKVSDMKNMEPEFGAVISSNITFDSQ